jgi:hypothetical protein
MRRAIAFGLVSAALVIAFAAPALAKDPFDPVITSDDVTTTSGDTATSTDTSGQPAVIGVPSDTVSDTMPTTGSDVSVWLVLAYGLAVTGGVALVLARTRRAARL